MHCRFNLAARKLCGVRILQSPIAIVVGCAPPSTRRAIRPVSSSVAAEIVERGGVVHRASRSHKSRANALSVDGVAGASRTGSTSRSPECCVACCAPSIQFAQLVPTDLNYEQLLAKRLNVARQAYSLPMRTRSPASMASSKLYDGV